MKIKERFNDFERQSACLAFHNRQKCQCFG